MAATQSGSSSEVCESTKRRYHAVGEKTAEMLEKLNDKTTYEEFRRIAAEYGFEVNGYTNNGGTLWFRSGPWDSCIGRGADLQAATAMAIKHLQDVGEGKKHF
jgi:hypothetical protein